ncbi:MAG: rRNA maturation RNase YbeY [Bacteroidota bacterium]
MAWISDCIRRHRKIPGTITFIFTSNAQLLRMNKKYLNHNYFTDVITFDYTEGKEISGDIFISIDQVRENAIAYKVMEEEELRRVMIHGVLHLIGFNDDVKEEQVVMREMEKEALNLWLKGE